MLQIRLLEPEFFVDGQLFLDPQALAWRQIELRPSYFCEHQHTVCLECIFSWAQDWQIDPNSLPVNLSHLASRFALPDLTAL